MFNYTHHTSVYKSLGDYRCVPLRGKRPLPEGWPKVTAGMPIDAMRGYGEKWSINDVTGYGILLGTPAGDDTYIIAVDIDVDDYDQIRDIRSCLPISNMIKRGARGMTLFYRTKSDLAQTRVYKGLVDYLGTGRQTVMPGSIHPDTGKAYEWIEGTGPVPAYALSVLTADHLEQMEEMLVTFGWDRRYSDPTTRHQIRTVTSEGELVEGSMKWLNRQALDNIPAWVTEIGLYNGKWSGARYACVNTMRQSSTGRPAAKRQRNLSIHPYGIMDFGSGQKFSPIDLVIGCTGFDETEAFKWLSERVDPNYTAKQDISALLKSAELKQATRDALKLVEDRTETDDDEIEFKGKVKRAMGPLPASALDNAPGFVGRCAREMMRHNPLMPRTMALLSAISTVSALSARRYVGETRGGTLQLTTYTCAMAGTGAGKDAALKFGAALVQAAAGLNDERCIINNYGKPFDKLSSKKERGCSTMPSAGTSINAMSKLIVAADLTGDAALFGMLWQTACPWIRVDEFGSVFAGMASKKKHSGTPLTSIFRSLYSYTPVLKGKAYAINQTVGDDLQALRDAEMRFPAITLFGVTTPEQMYDALDDGMIEDGTINRFLIAHEDPCPSTFDDTLNDLFGDRGDNQVSAEIAKEAIEIFARGARFGNGSGDYGFLGYQNDMDDRTDVFAHPQMIVVKSESRDVQLSMGAYVHSIQEERRACDQEGPVGNTIVRVGENFLRLCYLAAIADSGDAEPVVRQSHVDWAKEVMNAVKANLISLVSDHMGSRQSKELTRLQKRIIRRVDTIVDANMSGEKLTADTKLRGQWVPMKGILTSFGAKDRKSAREALKEMETTGDVIIRNIKPDGTEHKNGLMCCLFTHLVNK